MTVWAAEGVPVASAVAGSMMAPCTPNASMQASAAPANPVRKERRPNFGLAAAAFSTLAATEPSMSNS